MQRSASPRGKRSSFRRSGLMRVLLGPVGMVLLIVVAVMGVGYWAMDGKLDVPVTNFLNRNDSKEAQPQKSQQPAPAAAAPKIDTAPATPTKTEPQANANQAILDARRHIDRSAGAKETMLVTLYYADGLKNGEVLQPVEIRVPLTKSVVRTVAEQVLAAPADLKLYSNVPAGTKVKSVNLDAKTGVATVDLSPEVAAVQGSAAVANIQSSFVYSLTAIPNVKAVQLWVNGRPAALHGTEWRKPLTRADLEAAGYFKLAPVVKFEAKP